MRASPDLRSRVDSFVAELTSIVRQSALEVVQEALGGEKRGPGRPSGKATAKPAPKAGKRAKRDPEAVLELANKVLAAIKAKPGQSVEEIATGLRMTTKALKLPIIKLLEAKRVKTKGQRRGTRYFAG